jgi:hypothetical protein
MLRRAPRLSPHPDAAARAMRWYCVRVGLAVGASSLLELATERSAAMDAFFPAPMFLLAPVFAGITAAPPHLGACLRSSAHLTVGTLIGTPLSCFALLAVGWTSLAAVYGSLTVLNFLVLLLPATPPLATKVALIIITVSLFTAPLVPAGVFSALFPVQIALAGLLGQAAALVICALPLWPGGRACDAAEEALRAGERAAGALGALLARAEREGGSWSVEAAGAVPAAAAAAAALGRERADAAHASLASAVAALRGLREGVTWEARAGVAPPRRLARRTATLESLLLHADGMRLALSDAAAARRARRRAAAHAGNGTAALEADAVAACDVDARAAQRRIGAHIVALGDAADAALCAVAPADAPPPQQQHQRRWRRRALPHASASRVSLTSAAAAAVPPPLSSSSSTVDVEAGGAPALAARAALASFDAALAVARRTAAAEDAAAHSHSGCVFAFCVLRVLSACAVRASRRLTLLSCAHHIAVAPPCCLSATPSSSSCAPSPPPPRTPPMPPPRPPRRTHHPPHHPHPHIRTPPPRSFLASSLPRRCLPPSAPLRARPRGCACCTRLK